MVQTNKKPKDLTHVKRPGSQLKTTLPKSGVHSVPPSDSLSASAAETSSSLPLEFQQRILNVFNTSFPFTDYDGLVTVVQQVKGQLYRRDFKAAFGSPENLSAYALRWSATRALAYTPIFAGLDLGNLFSSEIPENTPKNPCTPPLKLVCIGGGAGAEVVACAAALSSNDTSKPPLEVTVVDIADWSETLSKLQSSLTISAPLSQYASESARAANRRLVDPAAMKMHFTQCDILECRDEVLQSLLNGVSLVTLMFTLNELFTAGIPATSAFLLAITEHMPLHSRLLVVDSPGSYSEVKLGKTGEAKRYPMKWLLDHTLLQVAGQGKWKKIVEEDSVWFRTDGKLKYPLDLENTRYQMHLYQRHVDGNEDDS